MWLFVGDMSCESFWKDFVDLSLTCWREERRGESWERRGGGKVGRGKRREESWEREEERKEEQRREMKEYSGEEERKKERKKGRKKGRKEGIKNGRSKYVDA